MRRGSERRRGALRGARRAMPPMVSEWRENRVGMQSRDGSPARSPTHSMVSISDAAPAMAALHMGGQGLAGTWAKSESGVAETFISLWLSSLILHVHPKKQPRAIGFLIARHVRAVAHKVLRALSDNARTGAISRQVARKAGDRYAAHLCTKIVVEWRSKALSLRVARLRLRTSVSRWLREELSRIFAAWLDLVKDTRRLVVAYDRITSRRAQQNSSMLFNQWSGHMDQQENKRLVLTRIVLRIQDRTMIKVLHLWFQVAGSLAIINHLAGRGIHRYNMSCLELFFCSWQDLRQRGLKTIRMMDASDLKWHRSLARFFFGLWFSETRHSAICAHRGVQVLVKAERSVLRHALSDWSESTAVAKRMHMTHVILSWRHARGVQKEVHEAWHQHVLALKCRFALLRRGLARWCHKTQRNVFDEWLTILLEKQQLRLYGRRLRVKHCRLLAKGAMELWYNDTKWSSKLVEVNMRITAMNDYRWMRFCAQAWREEANSMALARSAALHGHSIGVKHGKQLKKQTFSNWFTHTRECSRLESSMVLVANRERVLTACHSWSEHAIAWKRKKERFGRRLFAYATQVCKTALHGWVDVHMRTVIRASKLLALMWKWEQSKTLRFWCNWLEWMRFRAKVSHRHEHNVAVYLRQLLSNCVYEWACTAMRSALLTRSGRGLAVLTILRNMGAVTRSWKSVARAQHVLTSRVLKLSCRIGLAAEAEHFSAWREAMAETSYKALMIARQDTKQGAWKQFTHFEAWLDRTLVVRVEVQKHMRAKVHWEHATKYSTNDMWRAHARLQCRLRSLHLRVLSSHQHRLVFEAFTAWLSAQLWARAMTSKLLGLEGKVRFRLLLDCFIIWLGEKVRLKKLRAGLSHLIEGSEVHCTVAHFEEWAYDTCFTARNRRLAVQYEQRYALEIAGAFFAGWKERAKVLAKQARGVERLVRIILLCNSCLSLPVITADENLYLTWGVCVDKQVMRVDCRLLESMMDRWNNNVHNLLMYDKHCLRVQVRGVLFLARNVFNAWAYLAETTAILVDRCEHMLQAHDLTVLGNVVYWWHKVTHHSTMKFEGLDRCITRWQNRDMRHALDMWCVCWALFTVQYDVALLAMPRSGMA